MNKFVLAFIALLIATLNLTGCMGGSFVPVTESTQTSPYYFRNSYNPKQSLIFNLPSPHYWSKNESGPTTLYIPYGQSMMNWQQLISNQFGSYVKYPANATLYMQNYVQPFYQRTCQSVNWTFITNTQRQVIYKGMGMNCENISGQQLLYGKIIAGNDGLYLLQYQYFQAANQPQMYSAMVNAINNSRLVTANRTILR